MKKKLVMGLLSSTIIIAAVTGCATESHKTIEVKEAHSYSAYQGVRTPIAIGKFDNLSSFQRGIFSDGVDRLGNQAKTILTAHLQQTNYFNVLDRVNLQEIKQESKLSNNSIPLDIKSARYIVTGDVTEFGRKETGDRQLFGILGKGKNQIAYAKTTLNVINVKTSEVVCSVQGAGEYELSNREVIGFGGTASYDSTLNGKVLDLAISNTVANLMTAIGQSKCALSN